MKNVFKFIIIVCITLTSALCFSQSKEELLLNDENFKVLKKEAIELYTSNDYANYKKKSDDFASKLPKGVNKTSKDFETQISDKIKDSKFKNTDEAISQYKILKELDLKYERLEKEIFKRRSDLSDKYGSSLVSDVFNKEINREIINAQLGL